MHTLAVDSEGIVYCFGQGSGGQLGVTKTANITTPIPIDQDWSTVPPRSGGLMVSFRKSCLMMSDSLEEESESLSEGECEKSMEEVTMVIPPEGTSVDPPGAEPMDIDEQYGNHCMWYYFMREEKVIVVYTTKLPIAIACCNNHTPHNDPVYL